MGKIPTTNLPDEYTDIVGKTFIELGGENFIAFDNSGESRYFSNTNAQASILANILNNQRLIMDRIQEQETTTVLNSGTQYVYTYAEVSATPTVLLFSLKSVNPTPVLIGQLTVFKNGDFLTPNVDYTMNSVGLTLTTALVTDDSVEVWVYTLSFSQSVKRYAYYADTGTGSGNRIFTLANLTAADEISGEGLISQYPSSSSRLKVWVNGLLKTLNGAYGYTVSGSGSSTVVTFANDLEVGDTDELTDQVLFEIWSV